MNDYRIFVESFERVERSGCDVWTSGPLDCGIWRPWDDLPRWRRVLYRLAWWRH